MTAIYLILIIAIKEKRQNLHNKIILAEPEYFVAELHLTDTEWSGNKTGCPWKEVQTKNAYR
jgi:hypothetical protein